MDYAFHMDAYNILKRSNPEAQKTKQKQKTASRIKRFYSLFISDWALSRVQG